MQKRSQYTKVYPEAFNAMLALSQAVEKTGLPPQLIELVDYRVSQLNGCAFCLDMHSKDLRARGETEQRLYMISAWREAPHLYSDRERAALAWAEAVTRLENQEVPDVVYDAASQKFSEAELAQLTLAIVAINGWNRFNVAFRTPAGNYKSNIKQSFKPVLATGWSMGRSMGRSRWQLAKIRRCSGVSRFWRRATFSLGARPCSRKCWMPPDTAPLNGGGDWKADSSPLAIRIAPEDSGRRLPEADRPCSLAESTDVHGR